MFSISILKTYILWDTWLADLLFLSVPIIQLFHIQNLNLLLQIVMLCFYTLSDSYTVMPVSFPYARLAEKE